MVKLFKDFMPGGNRVFARLISQSLVVKLGSIFAMPASQDEFEKKSLKSLSIFWYCNVISSAG
jgi:hypothetical protein